MNTQDPSNMFVNKEFRKQLRNNPEQAIKEIGNKNTNDVAYKVWTNTVDTTYIVFPDQILVANLDNVHVAFATVGSAGSVGSVGTAGSVSTSSCPAGCVFCVGTAGSSGSIGTLGSTDIGKAIDSVR